MSAFALRVIACVAMLLDHIGLFTNNLALRAVGRIAFPIFVYLICNGFKYTSCRWRYALRLAVFALISQIPFSLMCANSLSYETGNVFITLFVALVCIWATDILFKGKVSRFFFWVPVVVLCVLYQFGILKSDYGMRGILMAMVFYLFDGKQLWKRVMVCLGYLVSIFSAPILSCAMQFLRGGGLALPALRQWDWWQLFSLCALPLIFSYNGKKGATPRSPKAAKALQLGFYLFYPVHMLLLWLINRL